MDSQGTLEVESAGPTEQLWQQRRNSGETEGFQFSDYIEEDSINSILGLQEK